MREDGPPGEGTAPDGSAANQTRDARLPAPPTRAWEWILVVVLALLQATLLAQTAWDKSDTADEPTYLGSAALQFVHHDFSTIRHAPLPKWAFGLALWAVDGRLGEVPANPYTQGRRSVGAYKRATVHVLWSRPLEQLRLNLFAARLTTAFITVLAGLFLWRAGRRYGRPCGLLTQAIWCFSPTVLAHGSLATLDGWVAALLAVTLWAALRFVDQPNLRSAATVGIAWGLACGAKAFALLALPVLIILVWRVRPGQPARPGSAVAALTAVGLGAGLTLWALQLFDVGWVNTWLLQDVYGWPRWRIGPVPFPHWIEGLAMQGALGARGRRNYLFGEVNKLGWWWFYLACVGLKTTVAAQALAVVAVRTAWGARRGLAGLWTDIALLGFPALLLVVISAGHTQHGIRYFLPAFPCLIVWLARNVTLAWARAPVVGRGALVMLLVAGATESLRVHPHHLMFFNLWAGGPTGGPRYFVVSDDWGQDQRRVAALQRDEHIPVLFYTPYTGRPRRWGIRYREPLCSPTVGVYALHAVEVHRPRLSDPGCLDWLTVEAPDERLGYSVYVYRVDEARLGRLARRRGQVVPFWTSAGSGSPEVVSPATEQEEIPEAQE